MTDDWWDMTDEEIEEEYWQNEITRAVKENTAKITDIVTKKVSEENSLDFARRLIEGGQLSVADIARYTGLPIERIKVMSQEATII